MTTPKFLRSLSHLAALGLLALPSRSAPPPPTLKCWYAESLSAPAAKSGSDTQDLCARQTEDGKLEIDPHHLRSLSFTTNGMAEVHVQGIGWVYVRPNGDTLPVMTYDNIPDRFSEGLVRGQRDGKIVYFGNDFKPAFPERFDWGWPFEGGRALVCLGCALEPDTDEEHRSLVGGRWGYIDHAGRTVVPVIFSRDQIRKIQQRLKNHP